jgi:uncharacterized membrane protein YjgN (DUF898 family)
MTTAARISEAVSTGMGACTANRNAASDEVFHATGQERRSHQTLNFSFHGHGSTLFGIQIVNVLLTLLTLGWYHFWAKARVRRYLFNQTECAGDRLAYHGTGKELCMGFLKAMVVFGIPYFCLTAAVQVMDVPPWSSSLLRSLGGLLLLLYVPIAMVAARRYRCSRTSWRGIRFCFHGTTWDFLKLHFIGWFFTIISLGIYYPYFLTRRHAFLVSHTSVGTQPFIFDGQGRRLAQAFVPTLLLSYLIIVGCIVLLAMKLENGSFLVLLLPLMLGPLWAWFLAMKHNFLWNHTLIASSRFQSTVTWQRFLTLYLGNAALLFMTAGAAWPWVTIRNACFLLSNLTLRGPLDFEHILQHAAQASTTGEGLSNLLDAGFDMD